MENALVVVNRLVWQGLKLYRTPVFVSIVNLKKRKRTRDVENKLKKLIPPAIIIIVVVVLDQITKILAVNNLEYGNSIEVIGSFFMLTLIYNEGGAMGTNIGSSNYYLLASIIILGVIFYYLYSQRENKSLVIPLSFISGGAIGNLIDRIAYGKVVDFLDFDFFNINIFGYRLDRWWTFNIADMAISLSILYLFITILFTKQEISTEENSIEKKIK
jgi:signal peptidase II